MRTYGEEGTCDTYRIGPNTGLDASTTTAFCTIERVTSLDFTRSAEAAICWLHLCNIGRI